MTDFGRIRRALIIFSLIVLVFVVTRQIFDFLGRLWSPIVCNFLQIVTIIFVCFGALQLRPKFLYVYFIWTPFWIGWNAFVICFYLNVGILNREDSTVFNWGTKGQSWWRKNVPGCNRIYNATLGVVIVDDCILNYFYVEIIQAALHIVLALIILCLSLIFVSNFKRKCHRTYGSLHRRSHPHVTVELTNGNNNPPATTAIDTSLDRLETSSGYLNASYERSPSHRVSSSTNVTNTNGYLPNGQMMQNYRRNSNRRRSAGGGSVQRKSRRDRSRDRLCPQQQTFQSAKSSQLTSSKRSRSLQMDDRNANGGGSLRRRSSSTTDSPTDPRPPRSHSDAIILIDNSSRRSSKRMSSRTDDSSPKILTKTPSEEFNKVPSTVFSYSAEPKRREVIPPKVPTTFKKPDTIAAAVDSDVVFRRKPPIPEAPNRHSLFSFDPKSNTLIRYHENLARSQETVLSGISSIDQLLKQNPVQPDPLEITSYDSGVPPSWNAPSVDTNSRNSQSYSVVPPPLPLNQRLNSVVASLTENNKFNNRSRQDYSLQNYNPVFSKPPSILSSFPDTAKSYEESDYLQPNSVLRNSLRGFGGAEAYSPPSFNYPSNSADTTIFESTPQEISPSSTPRSYYDPGASEEGPAIPKINDRGLLV